MRPAATIVAELQGLLQIATRMLGELVEAVAAAPLRTVQRSTGTGPCYRDDGTRRTARELAAMAGCSEATLQFRLRSHTPEEAVAMGPADPGRAKRGTARPKPEPEPAKGPRPARVRKPKPEPKPRGKYVFEGLQISAAKLARRAGCSETAMVDRLKRMSPEQAVAGGSNLVASRAPRPLKAAAPAKPAAAPIARAYAERQAAFDHDAPVFIPPDVKRTVAPTPPSRFHVEPCQAPQRFSGMRPGEYEATGSAIERAYSEREA